MAKLSVAGIPIHPLVNDLPAALIPITAAADAIGLITGDKSWSKTAYHTLILSLISGVAAGTAGAVDYLNVPNRADEKSKANTHALLNLGIVGAGFLSLMLRRDNPERPSLFSRLISFASVPLLLYSGIEGAILAYRYGMAETPEEIVTQAKEIESGNPPQRMPQRKAA